MSKRLMILAGVALAAVLLGAAVLVPAFADEPAPTPKAPFGHCGRGFGFWGGLWDVFDAAAEALGLTPEGLFAELHEGKSLADIADETPDVDVEAVYDAMKAARIEGMKQAIQQAVEEGRLSEEHADWLLKGLELGFLPRRGGLRFGPGRMRGRFGRFGPLWPPPTPDSSSSSP